MVFERLGLKLSAIRGVLLACKSKEYECKFDENSRSTGSESSEVGNGLLDWFSLSRLGDPTPACYSSILMKKVKDMSTEEVYNSVITPMLQKYKANSYCEFLNSRNDSSVGKAHIYVAHCSECSFVQLVTVLEKEYGKDSNTLFWLDIFCKDSRIAST